MKDISNNADFIDSRDVIARIDELTDAETELADARQELEDTDAPASGSIDWDTLARRLDDAREEFDDDAREELAILKSLQDECEEYAPDWRHGEVLIRESFFVEYAEQLADDTGAINRDAGWPLCHIDWEAAAESLKMDYTSANYDGVEYLIRCG